MDWMKIMQSAINYMETHILEEINYEVVAKQVHMSSYNFHRAFSFLSGMTANEYIRNRRLSLAGQELVQKNARVTDIALKYGYGTPESFTKAFTRFHGVAPKYAKISGTKLCLFNPLVIQITMKGGIVMDYRIVEKGEQEFIALVRQFLCETINEKDNQDIRKFWQECHNKNLVEPLRKLHVDGERNLYGLCASKKGEKYFNYGIGVIIDNDTKPITNELIEKHNYTKWRLEAGTYVVFKCIGSNGDCITEAWEQFYKEFLPQMEYEVSEKTDYEVYYQRGEKGLFCELYIPIQKCNK